MADRAGDCSTEFKLSFGDFPISEAVDEVIVHHPDCLHVCINNGGTHEEQEFGRETPLARIKTASVEKFKLSRVKQVSEATVDKYLSVFNAFFNWCEGSSPTCGAFLVFNNLQIWTVQ